MKAEIDTAEKEGFVAAYLIRFDNGLVLQTKNCLWLGREGAAKIKQQFVEVVEGLRKANVEIVDSMFNCTKNHVTKEKGTN